MSKKNEYLSEIRDTLRDFLKINQILLELVAYINTGGRPSRRERSKRRDSDVHGVGVNWLMGVIKW